VNEYLLYTGIGIAIIGAMTWVTVAWMKRGTSGDLEVEFGSGPYGPMMYLGSWARRVGPASVVRAQDWSSGLTDDAAAARALILAEPLGNDIYRLEAERRALPLTRDGAAVLIGMMTSKRFVVKRALWALSLEFPARAASILSAVDGRHQDEAKRFAAELLGGRAQAWLTMGPHRVPLNALGVASLKALLSADRRQFDRAAGVLRLQFHEDGDGWGPHYEVGA